MRRNYCSPIAVKWRRRIYHSKNDKCIWKSCVMDCRGIRTWKIEEITVSRNMSELPKNFFYALYDYLLDIERIKENEELRLKVKGNFLSVIERNFTEEQQAHLGAIVITVNLLTGCKKHASFSDIIKPGACKITE